jgi:class 3 adenylate cyclase
VVFCDLRGFTAVSETAEHEDLMRVLREFHETVGPLIFKFEWTLEHFAGDGLMTIFNDPVPCPDPAAGAVRMAAAMRDAMKDFISRWNKLGHDLGFGVGIAVGYAIMGQIGFEGRFHYGAIGSVLNLTSRLRDNALAGQILIASRVYAEVEDLVDVEDNGSLDLKGFHKPVPTLNLVTLKEDTAEKGVARRSLISGDQPVFARVGATDVTIIGAQNDLGAAEDPFQGFNAHPVAALFEIADQRRRHAGLQANGKVLIDVPARCVGGGLGVLPMVEHAVDHLHVPLVLHVAAHDAEAHARRAAFSDEPRDDGVKGPLAWPHAIGVGRIKSETPAPVLHGNTGAGNDDPGPKAPIIALDVRHHLARRVGCGQINRVVADRQGNGRQVTRARADALGRARERAGRQQLLGR